MPRTKLKAGHTKIPRGGMGTLLSGRVLPNTHEVLGSIASTTKMPKRDLEHLKKA